MIYDRCPLCNGKKKVIGTGCMLKECSVCHGIGHLVKEEAETVIKVKRSRKPKDEVVVDELMVE